MSKQRLVMWVGLSVGLLSGCSGGGKGTQIFAQLPDPNPSVTGVPVPNPSSSPVPTPRPTVSPAPQPTVSPNPVPPTPTACDTSIMAPWARWSTFSHKSAKFISVDIRQAVAARDLSLYDLIQGEFSPRDASRVDVVADTLQMEYVDVSSGGVRYATSAKIRGNVKTWGSILKRTVLDFDAEYQRLVDLQLKLVVEMKDNGTVKAVCDSRGENCVLTIKGTDPRVNHFTVEPAQLNKVKRIVVDVPKKATAVVVLNVKDLKLKDVDITAPTETLWTLGVPSGKFTIDFMTLTGTVVVATSTFEMDQAVLMGRVLAKEFVSVDCRDENSACSTIESSEMPDKICL